MLLPIWHLTHAHLSFPAELQSASRGQQGCVLRCSNSPPYQHQDRHQGQRAGCPSEDHSGSGDRVQDLLPAHIGCDVSKCIRGYVRRCVCLRFRCVTSFSSFRETTWRIECDVGGPNPCLDPEVMQNFVVTSSVIFTEYTFSSQPPRSRWALNIAHRDETVLHNSHL